MRTDREFTVKPETEYHAPIIPARAQRPEGPKGDLPATNTRRSAFVVSGYAAGRGRSGYTAGEADPEPCSPITLQGHRRGALLNVISYRRGGLADRGVTRSSSRSDTIVGLTLGLTSHDGISRHAAVMRDVTLATPGTHAPRTIVLVSEAGPRSLRGGGKCSVLRLHWLLGDYEHASSAVGRENRET
jgi:hypothetical protein